MKLIPKPLRRGKNSRITQIFVNDGEIKTNVGITNFVSFFSPNNCPKFSKFKISLTNKNGEIVYSGKISLSRFGSSSLEIGDLLKDKKVDLGLFIIEYVSPINLLNNNKDMGNLSAHIYTLYHDKKGSIGLVHPQQFIDDKKTSALHSEWSSQYVFPTRGLSKVEIYQLNALENKDMDSGFKVLDANSKKVIVEEFYNIKPRGVKKSSFSLDAFRDQTSKIQLTVKTLCGDNAKPIVFLYFDDNTFTATHS